MKSNLYTRTGDRGETSLVDGSRARKDSLRVDAYGDIDELSSALGLVAATHGCPEEIGDELRHVQHILFEVGAYLATPATTETEAKPLEGIEEETTRLEGWIDSLDERVPALRSFILPGGSEEASRCHLARTVCRRAERKIITLDQTEHVDQNVIGYVNRLSDYLFIAARYLNFIQGIDDIAWQKRRP